MNELFSAYSKYAAGLGFKTELLVSDYGHVVAKIVGAGVFRAFQHETGQHVCQRVPVTERKGRRHTSLIAVAVLPIRETVSESLNMSEVEITFQCGGGPGGQSVNKTASTCRAKHVPTGIQVVIQNERKQAQNKAEALRILAAKVTDLKREKSDREYAEFKKKQLGDGRRGAKVRTYNWIDSRVTDHRLGKKTRNIEGVMSGKIGLIL